MDKSKITNIVIEGIDYKDFPDLTDAYISSADYDGEPMNDKQLDEINQDWEFVHDATLNYIY